MRKRLLNRRRSRAPGGNCGEPHRGRRPGEAVAALLMRKGVRCELDSVGLPDAFLLAGALPTLHDRYGISTAKIVEKIKYRLR